MIINITWSLQIGLHYGGVFYEFVPWNGVVEWEISPWGYWQISAVNKTHEVIAYSWNFRSLSNISCFPNWLMFIGLLSTYQIDNLMHSLILETWFLAFEMECCCLYFFNLFKFLLEQIELEATTNYPGTPLRAPTTESGFAPACKDTCWGDLRLKMWERRFDGSQGKVCFVPLYHFIFHNCGKKELPTFLF